MSGKRGWNHGFVESGDAVEVLFAVAVVADRPRILAEDRAKERRSRVSENKNRERKTWWGSGRRRGRRTLRN